MCRTLSAKLQIGLIKDCKWITQTTATTTIANAHKLQQEGEKSPKMWETPKKQKVEKEVMLCSCCSAVFEKLVAKAFEASEIWKRY